MPAPTPYTRSYDFEAYQLSNPSDPLPADEVNQELDAVAVNLDEIIDRLALLQRDDGGLKNLTQDWTLTGTLTVSSLVVTGSAFSATAVNVSFDPTGTDFVGTDLQAVLEEVDTALAALPTFGTAAAADTGDFATAAQGALADSATQPGDLAAVATTGAYSDLSGLPTLGSLAALSTVNNGQWLGTDLAVTNGGTGASDASGARTNLGLVIGTDVQAAGATLASLEGLSLSSGDILYATGADTLARLAKGTDGEVLTLASGLPSWASGGGGSGVWELQETIDASATAVVDIDISASYKHYWIWVYLVPATDNSAFWVRTGTSGGIDSGASDYDYQRLNSAASATNSVNEADEAQVQVQGGIGNAATEGIQVWIYLRPTDGTRYTDFRATYNQYVPTGLPYLGEAHGVRKSTTAIETFRLMFDSGNIAIAKGSVYRATGA